MAHKSPPRAPAVDLPRVDVGDREGAKAQLLENGVCVFRNVATEEELKKAETMFWSWVERHTEGIKRKKRETVARDEWKGLGFARTGVMTEFSVGQSKFMWYLRTLPGVRKMWETLWETDDLVTSFDGCGAARNPFEMPKRVVHPKPRGATAPAAAAAPTTAAAGEESVREGEAAAGDTTTSGAAAAVDATMPSAVVEDKAAPSATGAGAGAGAGARGERKEEAAAKTEEEFVLNKDLLTQGGWYHLDQNGNNTPKFELWQGLLNFFDTTASSGSTVVVLGSHHRHFTKIFRDDVRRKAKGNFVMLNKAGDERYWNDAVQVNLNRGDFLIWDSRVVHCNQGIDPASTPSTALPGREREILSRLVGYCCMIPRAHLTETELKARRKAVEEGMTATHMPRLQYVKKRLKAKRAHSYRAPAKGGPEWALI